jgi:hypothetical protein
MTDNPKTLRAIKQCVVLHLLTVAFVFASAYMADDVVWGVGLLGAAIVAQIASICVKYSHDAH